MRKFLLLQLLLCTFCANAQQSFKHTSTASNISGNSTFISLPGLDQNPQAIIIIENESDTRKTNPHPTGVWFDGNRWAIFNQDMAPMPAGITFSIAWSNPGNHAFFLQQSAANTGQGYLVLDNPSLNKQPASSFKLSQVWNPSGKGGVYNNAEVNVQYEEKLGSWVVRNKNGAPLPNGAAFNIIITSTGVAQNKAATVNNNLPSITNPTGVTVDAATLIANLSEANLSFEMNLHNWRATGTAFDNQPVNGTTIQSERLFSNMEYGNGGIGGDYWKNMQYPIGVKGNQWIGTYENGAGDNPTGTLTSSPMLATKRYLHFLMGGGKDIANIYVELQIKLQDYQAVWGAGKRGFFGVTEDGFTRVNRLSPLIISEDLFRYYFDLDAELKGAYANKTVRICIVDNSSRGWGHINVDDFGFTSTLSDFIAVRRGGFGLLADKDKPVWGFGDTHAHWVNHVGLKGLMHGTPGDNWQTSDVRRDVPPCDGFNHGLPTLTPGMLIAQTEKAAWNRIPERMADPGNATCMAAVIATGIVFWPSTVAVGTSAGGGALFGAIGQAAAGAQAATGALDGLITGVVWGMSTNPAFQTCGYLFSKDVFAKHYGNTIPGGRPDVSNYVDFPRWNSFFHQMMHITWVRRSYEGGQRLMVVPVGTAKSWEFNTTSDGIMRPPKEHIEKAVEELKRIVNANNEWMQIALTPQQAREIILSNKMAVVIALEQAEVGSYFSSATEEINWLEQLGIRHVFPIHNINNKLGGAGVFNSALNSYNDLVNRSSNDGPIEAFKMIEGNSGDETRTTVKLNRDFMRQNLRTFPVVGFGTMPFFYMNDVPAIYNYDAFTFHKNAMGLTSPGAVYVTELMKKGMMIDVDHMSDLAQNATMEMMHRFNYPMISGHTNFRDLRRENNGTGGGEKEARQKTEFTIFNSRANQINQAGGMFGLMTQQNNVAPAAGCPVPNNAAGGSPSFAQAYWYALQKTNGNKGIAFGSDFNGFAPQIAPRFGVDAGFMLEGDNVLNVSVGPRGEDKVRRQQAFAQRNGVKYDVQVKTYHYHRFLKPAFLTSEEREIWEAIAIAKTGTRPSTAWQPGGGLSVERTGLQQDKITNMAKGFQTNPVGDYLNFLNCPEYVVHDENLNNCMPERKAAFMCVHGKTSLPENMRTARTMELYGIMKPIYDLWMQFENGPNEPLRRSFAYPGGRDFDFNLDGLAHYGMFPDLIQDLKNLGFTSRQLTPLFMAAEQYLKMWEQADRSKGSVR